MGFYAKLKAYFYFYLIEGLPGNKQKTHYCKFSIGLGKAKRNYGTGQPDTGREIQIFASLE